jgi:plasmid stabilization system protein ParE
MTQPVVLRPVAECEFDAAASWYEGQRRGLGHDFVTAVRNVFDAIANDPERYPIADGDVREAPVTRFPYSVYCRVKPGRVVVIAVFHASRRPPEWRRR